MKNRRAIRPSVSKASGGAIPEAEIETVAEQPEPTTEPITADDLNPKNWLIVTMESDCGRACTPNGCCGHRTDIPESLVIAGYELSFPWADEWPNDNAEAQNAVRIAKKLKEVFAFYAEHH